MTTIWKDVIAPATYHLGDQKVTFTRGDVLNFYERGKRMLQKGLQVPVPLAHQDTAKPYRSGDLQAAKVRNNTGEVRDYRMDGDVLQAAIDVQDDDIRAKLGRTIKYVSPEIEHFRDGDGEEFGPVITHVALTPRPVWHRQRPFTATSNSAASSALTQSATFADLVKKSRGAQLSFRLSLGDRLPNEDSMKNDAMADTDDADVDQNTDSATDDTGDDSAKPSLDKVIADLAATCNVHLPDDTTEDNFLERLAVVLKHMKHADGGGDNDAAPASTPDTNATEPTEEQPQGGYAMSHGGKTTTRMSHEDENKLLRAELTRMGRVDRVRRIELAFATGRIGGDRMHKLKAKADSYQFSLDKRNVHVIDELLEEIEALPEGATWAGNKKARMSHGAEVVEHHMPLNGDVDMENVNAVVKRLAGK